MNLDFDFFIACKSGDLEKCKTLFSPSYLRKSFENGQYTPLSIAISREHFNIVKFLLTHQDNPNQTTFLLKSPLHLAIPTMNLKICRLLLDFGSRLDATDKNGHTPLHTACFYKPKILKLLLQKKYTAPFLKNTITGATPLHLASLLFVDGHVKIDMLLKNGAGIDEPDSKNRDTPLHYAVSKQIFKNCEILLYNRANMFAKNKKGLTPYEYSQSLCCTRINQLFSFHAKKELFLLLF
jgi:prepilin-type processing-associated H-X9-DG protein